MLNVAKAIRRRVAARTIEREDTPLRWVRKHRQCLQLTSDDGSLRLDQLGLYRSTASMRGTEFQEKFPRSACGSS